MSLAAATGEDGPVLQVKDVEVRVGARLLLNPVSFQVATGDKIGLVGRNGAGKTTTLRILSGLLVPTSGRVEIDGVELSDSIRKITITANPNQACTEVAVVFTGDVELDGEIERLFADEPE